MTEAEFMAEAFAAAKASGHIFPGWAACEAAQDSKFGSIAAAVKANNLFGFRVPAKLGPGTLSVRIEEAKKSWSVLQFPSWEACFRHRAEWIRRAPMFYLARRAKTGERYIAAMNDLASNPAVYGREVTAIYTSHEALLGEHIGIGG